MLLKVYSIIILCGSSMWFQYRILYKILGTKEYLKKVNLSNDKLCGLCSSCDETIVHLFSECTIACELWNNVKEWIFRKLHLDLDINQSTKILGYLTLDGKFWPVNFILTITRHYIYTCSKQGHRPNIYFLQKRIMQKYYEQKSLFTLRSQDEKFNRKWSFWENIFDGIED